MTAYQRMYYYLDHAIGEAAHRRNAAAAERADADQIESGNKRGCKGAGTPHIRLLK